MDAAGTSGTVTSDDVAGRVGVGLDGVEILVQLWVNVVHKGSDLDVSVIRNVLAGFKTKNRVSGVVRKLSHEGGSTESSTYNNIVGFSGTLGTGKGETYLKWSSSSYVSIRGTWESQADQKKKSQELSLHCAIVQFGLVWFGLVWFGLVGWLARCNKKQKACCCLFVCLFVLLWLFWL